jgi:SAM-dependent methyltransferase
MSTPGWWLDELGYAGEEHLDPSYVATYDAKSGVDPTADLDLLRTLGLGANSTLVDLGAGTGLFALAAAPYCRRVVAVDVSPAMLRIVQANVEQLGLTNVEAVHAGLLSYEQQGEPADFVYSRNVLHHLPDFWKAVALQRVAGSLKPGGVLRLHDLVYDFEPRDAGDIIEGWLAGAAPHPEAGFTRPELETHVREEYSTFSWLMEPLLERAGFAIQDAQYRPSRTYAAYTCVRR